MALSCVVNAAVFVFACWAVYRHICNGAQKTVFRFYTTLSNLFCAAVCLAVAVSRIIGEVPPLILVLKYISTVSVTVTFMTVMLYLGPILYSYKDMLSGPDIWLHLICPVLAIVSLLLWDKIEMPFAAVFLGALPVLVYGCFYLYHVNPAPADKRWDDFYGFNRTGRWPINFGLMLVSALFFSAILWLL